MSVGHIASHPPAVIPAYAGIPVLGGCRWHGPVGTIVDGRALSVRVATTEPWAPAFAGVTAGAWGDGVRHEREVFGLSRHLGACVI